jgi:hypothetical protein
MRSGAASTQDAQAGQASNDCRFRAERELKAQKEGGFSATNCTNMKIVCKIDARKSERPLRGAQNESQGVPDGESGLKFAQKMRPTLRRPICEGWDRRDGHSRNIYSRNMSMVVLMVEVPTVMVKVAVAGPLTGFTQVSVLPPQNPLPGPVCPKVPKAVSS